MNLLKGRSRSDSSMGEVTRNKSERRLPFRLQRLRLGSSQEGVAPSENRAAPQHDAVVKVPPPPQTKDEVVQQSTAPPSPYFQILNSGNYGSGSYGKVLRGRDASGRNVAIKCVAKDRMRAGALESEVSILQSLSSQGGHPNIAAFRAWLPLGSKEVGTESGGPLPEAVKNCHMVVMEACEGGEMFEYVVSRGGLAEEAAAAVVLQVGSALHYAHRRGIAHRDIKLENILLAGAKTDALPSVKLIDWGLAHLHSLRPDGSAVGVRLRSRCGSRSYMSPEA